MRGALVDGLLALAVLSAWLGAIGFARLRTALDRLHCVTFVNVAAGVSLALAVAVQDGASSRSWKVAAIVLLAILAGAATSHALGRAVQLRDGDRE